MSMKFQKYFWISQIVLVFQKMLQILKNMNLKNAIGFYEDVNLFKKYVFGFLKNVPEL